MILEDETFEAFGYEVFELLPGSHKPILAVCELCGEIRVLRRRYYYTFCKSCANKTRIFTEETKAKISAAHMGKTFSEDHKALISKNHADFKGEKSSSYKGGTKIANARHNAKRQRELGYTLLLPLVEGEVGHHVTNEYVIGIPKEIHEKLNGGHSRKKHRTLVLQWLNANGKKKYNLVLNALAKEPLK